MNIYICNQNKRKKPHLSKCIYSADCSACIDDKAMPHCEHRKDKLTEAEMEEMCNNCASRFKCWSGVNQLDYFQARYYQARNRHVL